MSSSTARARRVTDVTWRIDVVLASSSCAKANRASAIVELALDDGARVTFECELEALDGLRESVAHVVHDMTWASASVANVDAIGGKARGGYDAIARAVQEKKA